MHPHHSQGSRGVSVVAREKGGHGYAARARSRTMRERTKYGTPRHSIRIGTYVQMSVSSGKLTLVSYYVQDDCYCEKIRCTCIEYVSTLFGEVHRSHRFCPNAVGSSNTNQ